jgi:small multidrug resistance pump
MALLFLLGAIGSEVLGTSLVKNTEGFTRALPTAACLVCYAGSILLLSRATESGMQVGVAYAVWSGVGTVAIVLIGYFFLGEGINAAKVLGILLVIAGAVLLNLKGAH